MFKFSTLHDKNSTGNRVLRSCGPIWYGIALLETFAIGLVIGTLIQHPIECLKMALVTVVGVFIFWVIKQLFIRLQ